MFGIGQKSRIAARARALASLPAKLNELSWTIYSMILLLSEMFNRFYNLDGS